MGEKKTHNKARGEGGRLEGTRFEGGRLESALEKIDRGGRLESALEKIDKIRPRPRRRPRPGDGPLREAPQRDFIRLVTFNMQYGTPAEGWPDGDNPLLPEYVQGRREASEEALEKTIAQLADLDPDFLLVQEVDKGQRRSGYLPHAEILGRALGFRYYRLAAAFSGSIYAVHRRPLNSEIPNVNGHGLFFGSRWPVRSWHVKRLGRGVSRLRWVEGNRTMSSSFWQWLRGLPGLRLHLGQARVLMAARVLTPFGRVAIGNAHLETDTATAVAQLRRSWRSVLGLQPASALLAGDFNLSPQEVAKGLELFESSERPGIHHAVPSFPARRPRHALDQLLGTGWRLLGEPRTERLAISDHLAVIYDLEVVRGED